MKEKYIYGIINDAALSNPAMEHVNGEYYSIAYQDISAIVSDSEPIDLSVLPKERIGAYLFQHQKVLELIMRNHTIIPMRLGRYARDESEMREILQNAYPKLKEALKKLDNKIEIDLVVTWNDFNATLKEIAESKDVQEYKQMLLTKPQGITLDDQMQIGLMIKKGIDKKKESLTIPILSTLKEITLNIKVHENADDKMVLNAAFLLEKSKHSYFEKIVNDLNSCFNETLHFRYVGPLPSYCFSTLELKKINFEEITSAKNMLNLQDTVSKEEIKMAYKLTVKKFHPDKNQGSMESHKKFDEINNAHHLLLEYCQGPFCSFKEEDWAKNSTILKVMEH